VVLPANIGKAGRGRLFGRPLIQVKEYTRCS